MKTGTSKITLSLRKEHIFCNQLLRYHPEYNMDIYLDKAIGFERPGMFRFKIHDDIF